MLQCCRPGDTYKNQELRINTLPKLDKLLKLDFTYEITAVSKMHENILNQFFSISLK